MDERGGVYSILSFRFYFIFIYLFWGFLELFFALGLNVWFSRVVFLFWSSIFSVLDVFFSPPLRFFWFWGSLLGFLAIFVLF